MIWSFFEKHTFQIFSAANSSIIPFLRAKILSDFFLKSKDTSAYKIRGKVERGQKFVIQSKYDMFCDLKK